MTVRPRSALAGSSCLDASPSPRRVCQPLIFAVCRESWGVQGPMIHRAALTLWEPSRAEFEGLSGGNEAHTTGMWPGSKVTVQEGPPRQSRSPNNDLLTRTEEPSQAL